jgi:hypothetical protein
MFQIITVIIFSIYLALVYRFRKDNIILLLLTLIAILTLFIVAADYQMGPYDGLVLTTGNPKSEYLKLNDVSLASKEDMCVYQGIDLPLDCKKTMFSGMGPSVTGVEEGDQNMFMLYRNKSSPECCPSTFSTSTGCVCTTQDQRDYVVRRGIVAPKAKSSNSNQ